MAAWVKLEEKASEHRQRKREAEKVDKVEVAPGVTVASLRRFRAALIGPTQGLPKRRRRAPYIIGHSMEAHGAPWRLPVGLHGGLHGDLHGDLHEPPWRPP